MAREQRRLAAIVAADVVGYSRLMGQDESGTLAVLKALRRDLVDPSVAAHGGRIVKATGDGLLLEFPSVVDAVRSAVEVQTTMVAKMADVPEDRRIAFRIGVNLGDIIIDADDIFGDGVNVAARLEGIAEPGGLCLSDDAYRQVRGKIDVTFDDLGLQTLKNIAQPVHAWHIRLEVGSGSGGSAKSPLALPDKPSIAVLPFQNMSGDPEQEYFVDGLVEEITTALSRISSFFVIARNSAFAYKGRAVDVRQIGRELGVRYLLEGSVRKVGNRLRITGQLIDTTSGNHIWAERYDGALEDVFELQDKITASVASTIEPMVQQEEIKRAQAKPTTDLTAYDLYLRSFAKFNVVTEGSYAEGLALLNRAVAADATLSSAYGVMVWCHMQRLAQKWGNAEYAIKEAIAAAKRAIQTGKDNPYALAAAGMAFGVGGDINEAQALLDLSLKLNANSALAWSARGYVSCYAGKLAQSIDSFQRAIRLSPFDPLAYSYYGGIAIPYFFMEQYEQATYWADRALALEPNFATSLVAKVVIAAMREDAMALQAAVERLLAVLPEASVSSLMAFHLSRVPAQRAFNEAALRKAGLPE